MNPSTQPKAPGGAPEALDPTIVNLAKAIRQTETRGQKDPYTARGGSGEFGAYQYTKGTWDADVKSFTGKSVPLEQADKLTQNEVAYKKLKSLKDKGYNVGQIASIWNSGKPEWEGVVSTGYGGKLPPNKYGVEFNVPQYVDSVSKSYQALKANQTPDYEDTASTVGAEQPQEAPASAQEGYKPWFQAGENDNPLVAGAKAFGNVLPSAFNFGKNVVSALNPINTLRNLGEIPGAFQEAVTANRGSVGTALGQAAMSLPGELVKAAVPQGTREIFSGDIAGATKTFTEDPFGQIAPYAFLAKPAARGVDALRNKAAMADYVKNLEANTRAGVPIPKATSAAETAVESAVTGIARPVIGAGKYAFGKVASAVSSEPLSSAKVAGKIVRGATTAEQELAARVLPKIDTSGVKTAAELSSAIEARIKSDLKKVDTEYAVSKTRTKLAKLKTTVESDVGGVKASAQINYVEEALKGLQELYFKTKDPASLARIKAVAEQARRQGLTADQINRIAREYGTEFGKKAFSARTGDPLTSTNAQAFENIRSGVKDTARSFLKTDSAKALDKGIGEMIKVKKMVDEVVEKVNALEQRITKRNLVQKITHAAGSAFETVTGGAISTLFTKVFLRSNIGMKEMNFFETEAQLAKNLATLKKLAVADDATLVSAIVGMLKSAGSALNQLPEARMSTQSPYVFGGQARELAQ